MDADALIAAFQAVLFERMPDGTFVCRSSVPEWCNPKCRSALRPGHPAAIDEVFPFLVVFLPDADEAWRNRKWRTSTLWTEQGAHGEDVHLEATATYVAETPVLVISRNERLFRQQQLLLQRARELRMTHRSLVRETEAKDVLVHAIVHDLGAPLHSILGALTLLEEQPLDSSSLAWVKLALSAAMRQRAMIREILDVFTAEHGVVEGQSRGDGAPDVHEVVAEVVRELGPVAERKGIRVDVGPRSAPAAVLGEAPRLVRVVANLLENAMRHSPREGVIRVSIEHENEMIRLVVEDEGPGVPAALRPRLFEKLGRDRVRSTGSGLGLYFCRITVERWGGRIGYEPRDGGGARFWIRLPAAAAAQMEPVEEVTTWRKHG